MIKKFKLLKDTPESKAGTVFIFDSGSKKVAAIQGGKNGYFDEESYKNKGIGEECIFYTVEMVEGQPEWFEEVLNITVEDDKQLFEGEDIFGLNDKGEIITCILNMNNLTEINKWQVKFSSLKSAEVFRRMNKGLYGVKVDKGDFNSLKEEAPKSKILIYKVQNDKGAIFEPGYFVSNISTGCPVWSIDHFLLKNDGVIMAYNEDESCSRNINDLKVEPMFNARNKMDHEEIKKMIFEGPKDQFNLYHAMQKDIIAKTKEVFEKIKNNESEALKNWRENHPKTFNGIFKQHSEKENFCDVLARGNKQEIQDYLNNKLNQKFDIKNRLPVEEVSMKWFDFGKPFVIMNDILSKEDKEKLAEAFKSHNGIIHCDSSDKRDVHINMFMTHDSVFCMAGEKVYGISLAAEGDAQWREQVLPFKDEHHMGKRVWFYDKEKANEFLIRNKRVFSVEDLKKYLGNYHPAIFHKTFENLAKERI